MEKPTYNSSSDLENYPSLIPRLATFPGSLFDPGTNSNKIVCREARSTSSKERIFPPPSSTELWGGDEDGAIAAMYDGKVALEIEATPSRETKQEPGTQRGGKP